MFRTDEIIKAAKLPPEGVAMSRHIDHIYFIPILFVTIIGTFHMRLSPLSARFICTPRCCAATGTSGSIGKTASGGRS